MRQLPCESLCESRFIHRRAQSVWGWSAKRWARGGAAAVRSWEMIGQGGRRIIRARGSGKHASDASGEGLGHGRGRRSGAIAEPPCRSFGGWRFRFVSPKPLPLTTTRLASHGLKAKGGARQHPARQLTALRPATTRNANPQRDRRWFLLFSIFFIYNSLERKKERKKRPKKVLLRVLRVKRCLA